MKFEKKHLKLNILSLFFVAISLISVTLAWFAYSGVASTSTEIDVKAWYIEFEKDNKQVTNEIVLSLNDVYPGMEQVTEKVNINNLGDTDAFVTYDIESARILNDELKSDDVSTLEVEDKLSHDYPFHINIALDKGFVKADDDSSQFEVSVSWPLDSEHNEVDSDWGLKAYEFQKEEESKKASDSDYQARTSLRIVISLRADQYVIDNEALDLNYNYGKLVLYDVVNNKGCNQISSTCLKTYVIDKNNKVGDTNVSLLPDLFENYSMGIYSDYDQLLGNAVSTWNVDTRALKAQDVISIISNDITSSYLVRNNISDVIIGKLDYNDRYNVELNKMTSSGGYYRFSNSKYPYFTTSKCYWLNDDYNDNKAFALVKIDDNNSKIYGELKTNQCSVVPVIIASKSSIN